MEYISYILITLGILCSCLVLMRAPAHLRQKKHQDEVQSSQQILQQSLSQVPTPWGWPGHIGSNSRKTSVVMNAEEVHGISESMHHFVDILFKEKSTVDDREVLQRKTASLRALVEDRYGRASTMQENSNRKVSAPHERIGGVKTEVSKNSASASVSQHYGPVFMPSELKELRKPWGW